MGAALLMKGQARGAGCWEVKGELQFGQGRVGASPLQKALLRLGPRPRAA